MKTRNNIASELATNNDEKNISIHIIMRNSILVAQILGFMPVQGIYQPDVSSLRFSWKSWRMLYAILSLLGVVFLSALQLKSNITSKMPMLDIHKLAIYLIGTCSSVLFIMLARNWPQFMRSWNLVEKAMENYRCSSELKRKADRIMIVFIILLIIEYTLIQLQRYIKAEYCKELTVDLDIGTYFMKHKFYSVYSIFSYDLFSAIILMYVHFQIIFSCSFVDMFIMIISLSLASRLKQITKRIKSAALARTEDENIWKDIREDYNRLECLCITVSANISYFIVLSFAGNLALILIQLFNSLRTRTKLIEKAYLYYSFAILLIKTAFVCIYGSKVNDESRKLLAILHGVPHTVYNTEIQRLIRQISTGSMVLSGLNFFHLRRDLVLKIAGALVTYELVLIQFTGDFLKSDQNSTPCTPQEALTLA